MNKGHFRCIEATNHASADWCVLNFFNFCQLIQQFARFFEGIARIHKSDGWGVEEGVQGKDWRALLK
jgi:hypothetical protein